MLKQVFTGYKKSVTLFTTEGSYLGPKNHVRSVVMDLFVRTERP